MTYAERVHHWNRWYDGAPQEWRFQIVFWFVIAVGAINMTLTIADGFPFGLLVLLAVIWVASVRLPYIMGWLKPAGAHETGVPAVKVEIRPAGWMYRLNQWYDGIPEFDRPYYLIGALVVAGGINMALTIAHAFTFGLLFLIALLAILTIRAPYVAGWYLAPAGARAPLALPPQAHRIEAPMMSHASAEPVAVEPASTTLEHPPHD
jgi:hypothetical protein